MRINQLLTLSMIGIAAISAMTADNLPRREVQKSKFGAMEVVDWFEHGMQKTVYVPQKQFLQDYES
jgi:hypothetical protein